MDYLNKVLGIKVTYEETEFKSMPNFITARYRLRTAVLDGHEAVFVYPRGQMERVQVLKKHLDRIRHVANLPVVFVPKGLMSRQKEWFIRERIAFVVEGRQIYLPFMALYLQERCNLLPEAKEEMLPSAQMLLLHFIYEGAREMATSQAAKDLDLTPTSISRASKQLESLNLLKIKKMGRERILVSVDSPKKLFEKSESKLLSPVKRKIYIPKECANAGLLEGGQSALSEYSMLNEPDVSCYATETISKWKDVASEDLEDSGTQVAVEMWRYDPRKLSDGKTVDELSLALALRGETDERVLEARDDMLRELWRKIDDCRD